MSALNQTLQKLQKISTTKSRSSQMSSSLRSGTLSDTSENLSEGSTAGSCLTKIDGRMAGGEEESSFNTDKDLVSLVFIIIIYRLQWLTMTDADTGGMRGGPLYPLFLRNGSIKSRKETNFSPFSEKYQYKIRKKNNLPRKNQALFWKERFNRKILCFPFCIIFSF